MDEIIKSIEELIETGSKQRDIIIAYPFILELPLQELVYSKFGDVPHFRMVKNTHFYGAQLYNQHPYMEICVYDSMNVYKGEAFIRKISINLNNGRLQLSTTSH